MKVTIYDIARACNVSIATVSRVLNNSLLVSAKTKQRILAKMEEMQYNPNPFARGIGLDSMRLIGLLCADIGRPVEGALAAALAQGFQEQGYHLVLASVGTGTAARDGSQIVASLLEKHVDAIVVIGSPLGGDTAGLRALHHAAQQLPVCLLQADARTGPYYTITSALAGSVATIVENLAKTGAKAPLYLYSDITYQGDQQRAGFRQGLRAAGLSATAKQLHYIAETPASLAALAAKIAKGAIPVDAIVTATDSLALGIQQSLHQAGHALPVVSCHDSLLTQYATPAITSLQTHDDSLAQTAVQTIVTLLQPTTAAVPIHTEFQAQWQYRASFPEP